MKDLGFTALIGLLCFGIGAAVALLAFPPVELEFIDDEMTKVMICRMSTKRGVVYASCADLQAVVDSVRGEKAEESSL